MDLQRERLHIPDKRLASVCGLFCPACFVFIATREDPERFRAIAKRFGKPEEDVRCSGCRSDERCFYSRKKCRMAPCACERGVDFCGECGEYPCDDLKAFQAEMPHRMELWESHARIREAGYLTWYREMIEHYSCPQCRTLNSAYDLQCRNCGREPSCEYVGRHRQAIEQHLNAR